MSQFREQLNKLEGRVQRLEKRLAARRRRELSLKERFAVHDRSQTLLRQFDEILGYIPDDAIFRWKLPSPTVTSYGPEMNVKEELGKIVKRLAELVDHALGV